METWLTAFSRHHMKKTFGKSSMWLELDPNPCGSSDHTAKTVNNSTAGGVWYQLSTFCPSLFKQGKRLVNFLKVITVGGGYWQLWSEHATAQIEPVSQEAWRTDPSIYKLDTALSAGGSSVCSLESLCTSEDKWTSLSSGNSSYYMGLMPAASATRAASRSNFWKKLPRYDCPTLSLIKTHTKSASHPLLSSNLPTTPPPISSMVQATVSGGQSKVEGPIRVFV